MMVSEKHYLSMKEVPKDTPEIVTESIRLSLLI